MAAKASTRLKHYQIADQIRITVGNVHLRTVRLPTSELAKPPEIREIPDKMCEIRDEQDSRRRIVAAANRSLMADALVRAVQKSRADSSA